MIDQEKFPRQLKEICDRAWKQDYNTTVNSMVEWIVKTYSQEMLFPYLEELEEKLKVLELELEYLRDKEKEDARSDGGIQKPQRNKKTTS